jgi:arylsulfatase A-like enzyme
MVRTDKWKYVHRYPEGPNELYNLQNDPDERTNLVDDPTHQNRIAEMRSTLEDWFTQYVHPEKDGQTLPVTGGGQLRPVGGTWEDGSEAFIGH